jgi:hypothetical protein
MWLDVLKLNSAFPCKSSRRPCSSIFQFEARDTQIRSFARERVRISFHLKLPTSPPSSGKRFRNSKFIVSSCRTVKHRSTSVKYGRRTWNSFTLVAKKNHLERLSPDLELRDRELIWLRWCNEVLKSVRAFRQSQI